MRRAPARARGGLGIAESVPILDRSSRQPSDSKVDVGSVRTGAADSTLELQSPKCALKSAWPRVYVPPCRFIPVTSTFG